jgi:exosortase/archaeosortase family protein
MKPPILWLRLAAFLALFCALYAALSWRWESLSHGVIDVGVVAPAAWIAQHLLGLDSVAADGAWLRSPQASIHVRFGCEGSDVLMLVAAAILATPVPWRERAAGLAAAFAWIFVLDQARVLVLFCALRAGYGGFGSLHGLVTPLAVVCLVGAFYLAWLRWAQSTARAHD